MRSLNFSISKYKGVIFLIVILNCMIFSAHADNAIDTETANKVCMEIINSSLEETNGLYERECWESVKNIISHHIVTSGAIYDYRIDKIDDKVFCNYKILNSDTNELEAWLIELSIKNEKIYNIKIYVK